VATEAFAGTGLALLPWQETLDRAVLELSCRYYLLHESGVSYPLLRHWPVIVERGRPLDKAAAAASTTCRSYLLQGLLNMTRHKPEDDTAAREDRPEGETRRQGDRETRRQGPQQVRQQARGPIDVRPVSDGQVEQIATLCNEKGVSNEKWQGVLAYLQSKRPGGLPPIHSVGDLSGEEAASCIRRLEKMPPASSQLSAISRQPEKTGGVGGEQPPPRAPPG
jgi:hypothetical protein